MSGFSVNWLRLRESADQRARNRDIATALERHFAASPGIRVVDLGCGTGANLRALRARLPHPQFWRLVDHDKALLASARAAIATMTDQGALEVVTLVHADLAADVAPFLPDDTDLVTAAAFFDLVSTDFIERLVATLAARRIALHASLIYDGNETWRPAHPDDATILAAFHVHQGRDKGFGPAAGPQASGRLATALQRHGYRVEIGASPWRLAAVDQELVGELASGIATAAVETGLVQPDRAASWASARRLPGVVCDIGHVDLFAHPRAAKVTR
jgi:SAM-dependent methyltransferase